MIIALRNVTKTTSNSYMYSIKFAVVPKYQQQQRMQRSNVAASVVTATGSNIITHSKS